MTVQEFYDYCKKVGSENYKLKIICSIKNFPTTTEQEVEKRMIGRYDDLKEVIIQPDYIEL